MASAARVLSVLLAREVSPPQILEKAVGLGLLHYPAAEGVVRLTDQAASRLFLAGYRMPAQVESGTLRALRGHLKAQRLVFALLGGDAGAEPELWQIHRSGGELGLVVGELLALEAFTRRWGDTGNCLIAALRQWDELPVKGTRFFGGSRDAFGNYHWDVAECETDAEGHILRF